MAGKSLIGSLRVTLGMDSAQFTAGTAKARKELTGLQKAGGLVKGALAGMFAAASIDVFARLAKQGLDYASSLGETAKQLGVSTRALQEYRYAATQVGLSQDEMDAALANGTKRLVDQEEAYKKLGVSIRDANGNIRDIGDLMPEIAEGLKSLHSPAERAAVLVDLFGKSGQKLAPLMEGGAAGVNGLRDAAQKLGIVMDDALIKKADDAADKMAELNKVLDAKIAIAVTENASAIMDLVDGLAKLVEYAGKAAYAWRAFKDLQWDGSQSKAFMAREFGAPAELTFTQQELAARRAAARGGAVNPGLLRPTTNIRPRASGTGIQFDKRFLPSGPSLLQRGNALGGLNLGGTDYSKFTPGSGRGMADFAADERTVSLLNARAEAALKAARVAYPALTAATAKLTDKENALRDAVQGVLDRLFPEEAESRQFQSELTALAAAHQKGALSATDHARAVDALRREYLGIERDGVAQVDVLAGDSDDMDAAADRARDVSDRIADSFSAVGQSAQLQRVQVVENFTQMVDGTLREVDRLVRGIKSGNALDIVGGLLNAVDGIARLFGVGGGNGLAGLFGGGGGGGGKSIGNIPKFASGGSMRLGGFAGVDRNMLSYNGRPLAMVSRDETMTIRPANDRGGAGGAPVVFDLRGAVMTEDLVRQMNQIGAQAAVAGARGGASLARAQMAKMQGRQLA